MGGYQGYYKAFYEYIIGPNDSQPLSFPTLVTVNPGDDIEASVFYDGSSQAGFSVFNFTNWSSCYINVPISPNQFNGHTAEFMDERPGQRGTNNWLAKFGTIKWAGCAVSTNFNNGTMYDFGKFPYERCDMRWNSHPLTSLGNPYIDYQWHQYTDAFTDEWQMYY